MFISIAKLRAFELTRSRRKWDLHGRFVLEVTPDHVAEVSQKLERRNVSCVEIGSVGGSSLSVHGLRNSDFQLSLDEIKDAYEHAIPKILGDLS